MLLDLKPHVVYGPVRSRRLGRSLGVNVLPPGRKVCSFNCLYCQFGFAPPVNAGAPVAARWPDVDQVIDGLEIALRRMDEPPDFLTFSGNGEATLHPRFADLVDAVTDVRNRLAPRARSAILSNSSRVADPRVRQALALLDARIMKLDAGSEAVLRRYNQPAPDVSFTSVVEGLCALGGVTLQSLFTAGLSGNTWRADVEAWLHAVVAIRPLAVQIYTLDRDTPSPLLGRASRAALEAIASGLAARGIAAAVF